MSNDAFQNLDRDGFAIAPRVLGEPQRQSIIDLLGTVPRAGRRGLLRVPEIASLALSVKLLDLIRPHVSAEPFPVRAIYFDKSPEANWGVPWHQDLTIATLERVEHPEFGPWSVKDGLPHVQPPAELLEKMLTVRIHLDAADDSNGALRVLAGTHALGRLSAERINELRATHAEHLCAAAAGDALLMRPLLLHASHRSTSDRHRRVLHIEYATLALPAGMEWNAGA